MIPRTARTALLCLLAALGLSAPAKAGLTFHPIYFESRSAELNEASVDALKRVAELLKVNKDTRLRLQGHAGIEGADADPQTLSETRAENAKAFLQKLKIAPARLETVAVGTANLQNPDKPEARENRRVEFTFLAATTVTKGGRTLEKINVVYWPTLYHCLYNITYDQGFFEKEGFDANLVATNHSTVNQVNAICGVEPFLKAGNTVFVGGVCGGSPHEAIAKGVPLVVIGGMLAGGSMLIGKPETAAKLRADWKNFKGIRIGRPRGTVLTSMIVSYSAYKHGIDHQKDMKWKLYDSHEEVLDAIVRGEIDVGDTYAPLNLQAQKKYGLVTIFNTVELFPYHPCCRIITTKAKLKTQRERYVRFMKAVIQGHGFFIRQPIKSVDIVQKYTGYAAEEIRASLLNPNFMLNPDPLKNGFVKFWNMMNETKFISSALNINEFIDTSVYEDALKKLIEEEPQNPYYRYMMKQFREQNT